MLLQYLKKRLLVWVIGPGIKALWLLSYFMRSTAAAADDVRRKGRSGRSGNWRKPNPLIECDRPRVLALHNDGEDRQRSAGAQNMGTASAKRNSPMPRPRTRRCSPGQRQDVAVRDKPSAIECNCDFLVRDGWIRDGVRAIVSIGCVAPAARVQWRASTPFSYADSIP